MAAYDNSYSRIINGLKVILPLMALALLSTLFLFARSGGVDPGIPYAEIADIAHDPRISNPAFAGIADDGSIVSVMARAIRPEPGQTDRFTINDLKIDVDATDGSRITITAGDGHLDGVAEVARLTSLARVTSTSGYLMETRGLVADLKSGTVESIGPLEARAPFGDLTAGGMRIAAGPDGAGSQIVFNKGVRLLYQPQQ